MMNKALSIQEKANNYEVRAGEQAGRERGLSMDVVVTITEFKNHLKALGYAAATVDGYRKGLNRFGDYLKTRDITDIRKVTEQVIADYQAQVTAMPIAMESRALLIRPVKRLFEHLVNTNRLLVNPAEGIVETRRKGRSIGPVLSLKEAENLLLQPNLSLRTGIRDRAILEVLYACGIRLGEMLALEVYHADLKDRMLYIRKGKGGAQRVVPLGKRAAGHLKEYLEKVRPYYAKKQPRVRALFLLNNGMPMNPESVRQVIRKYRLAAGIEKPVSPHMLRRTCATHLLQQGADIVYIQKLLGHRRLDTTRAYTKVMPVEVKQTHARTHPGSRL